VIRRRTKVIGLVVLLGVAAGVVMLLQMLRYGFSAKDEPSRIEKVLARTMRRYAAPAELRGRKNPLPLTPAVLAEGRAHFADHCATCHGNDGKGQTEMGPNFYPKVPDMTLPDSQSQSDGALFAIIENGIRLTGMPAWGEGTAESAYGSWSLVHFIRHLPGITPEELAEMEQLNPKTREEWESMEQEKRFLAGEEGTAQSDAPPAVQGHHH
jgi:mono/diheme cytochrome c family protein